MNSSSGRLQKNRETHPIRLIRNVYARSGFRQLSTAAGFSRMAGCSDSLVRNTESGIIPFSEKLAQRIESATGVAATWLLDTAAKWDRGDDVSKEKILDANGKPWRPSRQSKFHFTDELLDVAELVYERFPTYLPPLMGAMMEALVEVGPTPGSDRHSPIANKRYMRKYVDTYLLPMLRLVGELEGESREQFLKAFTERLEERDAATSSKLLDLWNLMHARDNYTSPPAMHSAAAQLIKEPMVAASKDSKRGSQKRGRVKK